MNIQLVIPHYLMLEKLEQYLPDLLVELKPLSQAISVMVVDDGSGQVIQRQLQCLCSDLSSKYGFLRAPLLLDVNKGKGAAVRAGWYENLDADFFSFVDADASIPASEVCKFLTDSIAKDHLFRCAIRPGVSVQTRSLQRRIGGASFSYIANWILGLDMVDPQCGFKVIPGDLYRDIRPMLKVDRFAFDCELLAFAKSRGYQIEEVEVPWTESEGSTVRLLRDGGGMLLDILKLRFRSRL